MVRCGQIKKGSEVFIFTDNAVMERTYIRGSSKSPKLHDLIVELRKLQMDGALIIHFIWIAGTRMIRQGTDALSRGLVTTRNMSVDRFLRSLPLNKTAFELQDNLQSQVKGWLEDDDWEFTETKDWFYNVFTNPKGSWVWCPPPALGRIAIDQLCEVKHMHPESRHIFLCPTLMEQEWGKALSKIADTRFTFGRKSCLWNKDLHEPLTIAFVCPLLSSAPWKVSRLPSLANWERRLFEMPHKDTVDVRDYMREFWMSH